MTIGATMIHALGLAGAFALLGATGTVAVARGTGATAQGRSAWLRQRLGLTDQQVAAIQAATGRLRDQMRQTCRALWNARGELRTALAQDPRDTAALQAAKDQIKALLAQQVDLTLGLRLAVRQQLTQEQRGQPDELFAQRKARWFRHRGLLPRP